MKINPITSAIALGISGLIAYGFYSFNAAPQNTLLCAGSFLLLSITSIFFLGVQYSLYRSGINTRSLSIFFFSIALVSNLIFTFIKFSNPAYIITHGLILLLYLLMLYYLSRPVKL